MATEGKNEKLAKSLWISVQPQWNEAFLTSIFSGFGGFVKAAVIGNKGYGFLDFDSHSAAAVAMKAMQEQPVPGDPSGQRFRLKWGNSGAGTGGAASAAPAPAPNSSSSTAASPAAGEHSIFVGDLPYDASDADVTEFFRQFYPSCVGSHIVTDSATGKSRGYGFVRFTSREEKLRALQEMPAKELGGRPLRVGEATPKPEGRRAAAAAATAAPATPLTAAHATPVSLAPPAGAPPHSTATPSSWPAPAPHATAGFPVQPGTQYTAPPVSTSTAAATGADVPVVTPLAQGMPAGMPPPSAGSGTNSDPAYQNAVAAVAAQAFAPQPAVTEGNTTVFVGGLDKNATEAEVRYHFHRCGPVSSVKVLQDKGCGFVQFQYRAHAETAIASLNGSVLGIGPLRLQWGKNAARNAMAAQATLPGAVGGGYHAGLQTHHHVGYGNAMYANGAAGGFPGMHMGGGGMMHPPHMAHMGGGHFHPAMAFSHGMPSGMPPQQQGAPATSAGFLAVQGGHAGVMGGLPGQPQAPTEGVHMGSFAGTDLSSVAGTHDPWSFGNMEQKSAAPMWGAGPFGMPPPSSSMGM